MAQDKDNAVISDTEGQEKPVREQLKKASIAGFPQDAVLGQGEGSDADSRGRTVTKKRSFEEVESGTETAGATAAARHHSRKRSRGSSEEEYELNNGSRKSGEKARTSSEVAAFVDDDSNGEAATATSERPGTPEQRRDKRAEAAVEEMTSPKTKRSRLHSTAAGGNGTHEAEDAVESTEEAPATTVEKTAPLEAAKPTEDSTANFPADSGFANTSAVSPFGALAGSKSPAQDSTQTSASAFASSGFGALSGSTTSGFGAIGKTSGGFGTGGGFGNGAKSPAPAASGTSKDNEKAEASAGSTFGGALGAKSAFTSSSAGGGGFGSGASGFGTLGGGGGFGGGLGGSGFGALGGGGLSSFASGKPTATFGSSSKSGKAFGAPKDDDEDEEGGGDDEADSSGVKSPLSQDEDKRDERFYERELETGEEEELTYFSCRAKLYTFATLEDGRKEWKERGLGTVRLKVKLADEDAEDQTPKARLLMRADGSHRVVLNTPMKKEIPFGTPSGGGPPSGGSVFFQGTIDNKTSLQLLQLRIRQQLALELHEKIEELKQKM